MHNLSLLDKDLSVIFPEPSLQAECRAARDKILKAGLLQLFKKNLALFMASEFHDVFDRELEIVMAGRPDGGGFITVATEKEKYMFLCAPDGPTKAFSVKTCDVMAGGEVHKLVRSQDLQEASENAGPVRPETEALILELCSAAPSVPFCLVFGATRSLN
ncbi:MAG: hypothetical protein AB7G06_03040 [Bdellovibrionales bacterium]